MLSPTSLLFQLGSTVTARVSEESFTFVEFLSPIQFWLFQSSDQVSFILSKKV